MEVRLLGPVEASTEAGPVTISSTLQRGLLAMLALGTGRAISTDALIDGLWGDKPPEGGVKSLRFHVSRLRRSLMDDHDRIVARGHGYALEVAPDLSVDTVTFETAVTRARSATSLTEVTYGLRCALELWRGSPLSDVAHLPFADAEIRNLEERRLTVVEAMIDAALSIGDGNAVLPDAERLAHAHPLLEPAWALLIRCLYQAGRQADALAAYERLRTTLVEELGIDPGPPLQRLHLDILQQAPSLSPSAAAPSVDARVSVIPLPLGLMHQEGALPMVGRDVVSEMLAARWKRAVGGSRQVVFVSGEPGVGKTRLAAEMAREASDAGGTVLFGRCDEDAGVAYQPFAEALGHYATNCPVEVLEAHVATFGGFAGAILPELGRRLGALDVPEGSDRQSERRLLFDALTSLLSKAAEASPVLLILDDLHWASTPTLLLMRHLLRSPEPTELMILATYRDTDLKRTHPLTEFLADLRRTGGTFRLPLRGLDEAGVQALVEAATGEPLDDGGMALAGALYAETEGNPFFASEVLRHLSDQGSGLGHVALHEVGIPEGVREVIGRRLGRLSDDANKAITVASVIGAEFDLRAVGLVSELSVDQVLDAIDEAIAAGLVAEVAGAVGRCRFAHALVRQTLYEECSSARRAQLHRRVGETLESLYAHDLVPHLALLAFHYAEGARAGDSDRAIEFALRAGADAVARTAFEEAEQIISRALALYEDVGGRDRAAQVELLLALVEARAAMMAPGWRETALQAADVARSVGSGVLLARSAVAAGHIGQGVVDPKVEAVCEEALNVLSDRDGDDRLRALLLASLSTARNNGPRGSEMLPLAKRAVELALRSGDVQTRARAYSSLSFALVGSAALSERFMVGETLLTMGRESDSPLWEAEGFLARGWARLTAGDRVGFEEDYLALLDRAQRARSRLLQGIATYGQVVLALLDGRFPEIEELAGAVLGISGDDPSFRLGYFVSIAALHREQGRLAEFLPVALEVFAQNPLSIPLQAFVAQCRAELGAREAARQLYAPLVANDCAGVPRDWNLQGCAATLAETCALLEDLPTARTVLSLIAPFSGQLLIFGELTVRGAADHYLGVLETVTGDVDAADEHFRSALVIEERCGGVPLVARSQYRHARLLQLRGAHGDCDEARALLASCVETTSRLGMADLERRARDLAATLTRSGR